MSSAEHPTEGGESRDRTPSKALDPGIHHPPGPRWRFLIAPRWLGWHAFVVGAVVGMLWLGDWQFRRAEAGNALSWAYTFEWPVFAIFAVVFWVKTIIDEFRPTDRDDEGGPVDLPAGASPARQGDLTAGDADAEEHDPELAAYNAYLARLNEQVQGHGRWHGLR
jgi:DNA-binding transcriptional regulator of glucitol operon